MRLPKYLVNQDIKINPKKMDCKIHVMLLALILFCGCAGKTENTGAQYISAADLSLQLQNTPQEYTLIDVRQPDEYAQGHIHGAVNIPLGDIENRIDEIPKNKGIITICKSGIRSEQAANILRARGYNVRSMQGGMLSWNGPLEN
jgi:rhodanese-related sulfurtransferase